MIRVLFAFIVLLGAVALGIQLHHDSGYVLISINHWTIETTFWVAVFALLFFFLLVHLLIRLCHKLAKTPGAVNQWYSRHLAQKAQTLTRRGLIEYSEGYWLKARNHLITALPHTDTPLINYLTAARAAQKMGDSQLRDNYLRQAQQSMPEAKIAVELTQAQLQLANHQWEQALATLKHLQDLAPRHPYVLKLLMHLYEEVKDWMQLIALLPLLKKNQVITQTEYEALQQKTYYQAICELAKLNQSEALTTLFNALPKSLANNPQLVAEYARFLIQKKEYSNAEALLQRCLRKEFQVELIEVYELLPPHENQLNFLESLLKKNPHCATLHLCLGRVCMAQHLWGKSRHYLEQSIELKPTPLTYFELGKLHERLNDASLACANYKKRVGVAIWRII